MNSLSKNGETQARRMSEPPPLHGLQHTMLSATTLAQLLQDPWALTERQERRLRRADFLRRIAAPLLRRLSRRT